MVVICVSIGSVVTVVFAGLFAATQQWRRRRLRIFADIDGNHVLSNAVYEFALLILYLLHLEE